MARRRPPPYLSAAMSPSPAVDSSEPSEPSHATVWRLAVPVTLANLTIPLLGAVDTAVMGRMPDASYIGGVAIGALIFSFVYWGFGFLRMGTTGFVAQALGAGDKQEIRAVLGRAVLIGLVLAAALILLREIIASVAFALLDASDVVEALAGSYFEIRIWGAPGALFFYVSLGWLFGMQRMGAALALTAWMNGLNIALNLLFVLGLGLGIEGVAFASLIAEWSAIPAGLLLMRGSLKRLGVRWRDVTIFDRAKILALVRVNADIFIRTVCLIFAFAWFTAQGARLGDLTLAANAILLNFQTIMAYGLDGFAHAAETLVGNAVGGRRRSAFRAAVKISTQWALAIALTFTIVYAVAGIAIIELMTDLANVRSAAADYLIWAIASPLVSVWSFQLDGIFVGATRTAEMRNGMLLSLAGLLIAGYALVPFWGNHGLWLALLFFLALRAVTLGFWLPRIDRQLADEAAGAKA